MENFRLGFKFYKSNVEVFVETEGDERYIGSINIALDNICSRDDYELYEGDAVECAWDFVVNELDCLDYACYDYTFCTMTEADNFEDFQNALLSIVEMRVESYFDCIKGE